jgi:hypothetical protein
MLLKMEDAWSRGYVNGSCTSCPCEWNAQGADKRLVEPKRVKDMQLK